MELKTKKTSTSTKIEQYVLIEPCYSIRFIPFIFECHQVSVLCVAHKTASRIMVLRDSHQLDIQFSFFRLTMSHTMKGIMVEHFNPNLVSRLRKNRKYLAMLTKNSTSTWNWWRLQWFRCWVCWGWTRPFVVRVQFLQGSMWIGWCD